MTRDEAIKLVDERESAARRRFEQLRDEMTGRTAAAEA
jgi:vacuolar-type H+-ATPase subunit H